MTRFPCNCLIVALICGRLRVRSTRNADGDLHFYWRDREGLAWHFTSGTRPILTRLLYLGSVRRLKRLDAARG